VATVTDPSGQSYLAAYVPSAVVPTGLAVIETLALPDVTADIARASRRDFFVIGSSALVAVLLAWLAGQRFIYQPTEVLLRAARRWREGDLSARARLSDTGSEFTALAQSFNAMAGGLEAREMERRLQASFLEARVAERTRELSETNNRLQVEIAGREKTEAALLQARKLQAVGQLAGGIAHDFNNMLATVLGNLELMERRVARLQASEDQTETGRDETDRLQRLIERATGAAHRGSQLTSRLLAFSRRQRLAARPTDINALLRELITLASSTLGRGIKIVPRLVPDLWRAQVDPSQLEAAILNLCLNARDAMPDGGQVLISTANQSVGSASASDSQSGDIPPGDYVTIRIADTGTGMTAEVQARAFDPFFTTKGPSGSGLGLSQVYGMVRQSGGTVTIESAPGQGTHVTVCLPRAASDETGDDEPDNAAPETAHRAGSSRDLILVVDDDAAVRQVTADMMHDLGCSVAQAASGEQALALIGSMEVTPDLILLDYAMPGLNGLQVARKLRLRGVTAPIALITGYAELADTDLVDAQLAGLLHKPFTIRDLETLLVRLHADQTANAAEVCLEPGLLSD
jgi:signal transduction histidine kinase/CheY-like chemotaxis protein